jgi:hypothetical protein
LGFLLIVRWGFLSVHKSGTVTGVPATSGRGRARQRPEPPHRVSVRTPAAPHLCYCATANSRERPSSIRFPPLLSASVLTAILFGREAQLGHYPSMIGGPEARWGTLGRIHADHLSAYDLERPTAEEDVIPPVFQVGGGIEEIIILATGEACTATSLGPGIDKADLRLKQVGVGRSPASVGYGV